MTKFSKILAGAASLALLAGAAHAETLSVKASDLDLSSPAGQKELDKRAEGAARAACKGMYMAQVNCVPGAKAKIIARATAQGEVTIEKNGRNVVFSQADGAKLAQN